MQFAAIPIVSSAVALLLAGTWQLHDHGVQRDELLDAHRERGAMVLAAIEGTAARELRGGRYVPESLQDALDTAFARFDLEWLRITDPGGGVLAELGPPGAEPEPLYRFEQTFEPIRPRDPGRGWRRGAERDRTPGMHASTRAVNGTPLTLSLSMNRAPLQRRLSRSRARFLLSSAAIALAIGLFGAVFWTRLRAQALRSQLDAEHKEVESLDRLRRVGAGLVHETKNPLGVVRGLAERMMRTPMEPERLRTTARAIVEETDRTVARLDEFLLFSRPATLRRERFGIRPLFDELAELIEPELEVKHASLTLACDRMASQGAQPDGLQIDGDRDQLRRLFLNLLLNATRAIEDGGHVWLRCSGTARALELVVEDDGPGVPSQIHDTLFEPYVTESEGGSGLGLSICARVAQDHGFTLRHEPRSPRGARMILEIPRP